MRFVISLFVISCSVALISCKKSPPDYQPDTYISKDEQVAFKERIIRYVAKPPRRVIGNEKFNEEYDEHYANQVSGHELIAYYINKNDEHFFLMARIAPSMDVKWVATGGRLKYNKDKEIMEYEEIFRTWKHPYQVMEERSKYLFDLMVRGEDLKLYYTATAGFEYIEFPDEDVYYDKAARSWKSRGYTSIEEMVYESRDADSLQKK